MTINLNKPEIAVLIQKRLDSGVFGNTEDVIYRALESQDAEEAWLLVHQREVSDKIDQAIAEFDRGEGIPASEVRQRLQEMRASRPTGSQ